MTNSPYFIFIVAVLAALIGYFLTPINLGGEYDQGINAAIFGTTGFVVAWIIKVKK